MRILQINASYKPAYIYGGPTMSVSKLSEALIKAGCDVLVLTTTANGPIELPESAKVPINVDGVNVLYFKRLTKDHSHFSPDLLRAVWGQCRTFDVVHIHGWWNTVSVLSCLIAKVRGAKVIVSPRGMLSSYSFQNKNAFVKKSIHNLLGRPLFSRSVIHSTSAYEQANISQVTSAKRFFNIPNFVGLSPADTYVQKREAGQLNLIFLSRIEEKKGLDLLIQALPRLTIPYHLTIAGSGQASYIDSLKALAEQLSVAKHITWVGFQSDEKFKLLAASDLFILPSHDENFGNAVIESLSAGTPVLISEQVGLASYVKKNNLGWICQTESRSIAQSINQMDTGTLANISEIAPAIIRRDFAEAELVKKYIEMYQQVIQHG